MFCLQTVGLFGALKAREKLTAHFPKLPQHLNPPWPNTAAHPFDWPRTYPPRFGKCLRRLYPRFLKERVVEFSIPEDTVNQSLESFFGALVWDDLWEDAKMVSILCYARGSYHLHLGHWRGLFPESL